jgi:hypothetical protein
MKQVDFDVRSFNLTAHGTEDGTTTRSAMKEFIKTNYPFEQGWKIETLHVTHNPNNGQVMVAVFLVQYEVEEAKAKK